MITPFEIYWILQLDSINAMLTFLAFVSGIVMSVLFIVSAIMASSNPDEWSFPGWKEGAERNLKRAPVVRKYAFRVLIFVFAPALSLATLMPSTRTAAAMIVAPKIINSPTVQHEAGDLYKLAKQALENAVSPEHGDKGGAK